MRAKTLTKNEKDTLWAMVNYPTLHDRALARKTRLKLSTVTAIRRRMQDREYFWTLNIPNFYRLGCEIFSVEYGVFNEAVPLERRIKYFTQFVSDQPGTIFAVMSRSNGVIFNIARNYCQATTLTENMEMFFTSHHLMEEGSWNRAIFPLQTSRFWNFFSFSPVLRYVHSVKKKTEIPEYLESKMAEPVRLSRKEKMVLYALVRYPEDADSTIADRFDVSRQAISNIRRRFLKDDMITTRRVLNFKHMGCSLLSFAYTFFGPRAPLEARRSGIEYTKSAVPVFCGISNNFENVIFAATKGYGEYEQQREHLLSFYKSHLSIAKPPRVLLFPVKDICYCKKPTFHAILGQLLEIEESGD